MPLANAEIVYRLRVNEQRFNAEKVHFDQLESQIRASETEIHRLQGEHRVLESLQLVTTQEAMYDQTATGVTAGGISNNRAADSRNAGKDSEREDAPKSANRANYSESSYPGTEPGEPSEAELVDAPDPKTARLHPVDKTGVPAEAQVMPGGFSDGRY